MHLVSDLRHNESVISRQVEQVDSLRQQEKSAICISRMRPLSIGRHSDLQSVKLSGPHHSTQQPDSSSESSSDPLQLADVIPEVSCSLVDIVWCPAPYCCVRVAHCACLQGVKHQMKQYSRALLCKRVGGPGRQGVTGGEATHRVD